MIYDYWEHKKNTANEYLSKLEQKLTPYTIIDVKNEADKMIKGLSRLIISYKYEL